MTISDYLAKFTQLERVAPGIYTSEVDKAKRFKWVLHLDVLESIVA